MDNRDLQVLGTAFMHINKLLNTTQKYLERIYRIQMTQ